MMGSTPFRGRWWVGLLLVLLLVALTAVRAAPPHTIAWAQEPDETPGAEPTVGAEPTSTPSDVAEPTSTPQDGDVPTSTAAPAPGTPTATPAVTSSGPPSPTPTAVPVAPTPSPGPDVPPPTPAAPTPPPSVDSGQPSGGEGLVRLPEGEAVDQDALAAAGSRTICGVTVTAQPYTLPYWFDGTATIVGSDGQFLGVISPSEVASDSIMNSVGSYGSTVSSTSIFNSVGQYGSSVGSRSACNTIASSSNVPRIVWGGSTVAPLSVNTIVTNRIDPRDLVSAVLYWQTLVAPPVPTATPTVAPGTGGQTTLLSQPQRVVDTRPEYGYGFQGAGQPLIGYSTPRCYFVAGRVGVPADATGVLANVAIIGAPSTGHLIIWPAGQPQPVTANMNYNAGVPALSNMVTVRLGTGGQVCVVGAPGLNVAIDIAAYIR